MEFDDKSGKSHIAVVAIDDDDTMVELYEAICHAEGLAFYGSTDPHKAEELVHRAQPDVILLDIMMPELDGFEVCRRLKADPHTQLIPVVLVTGLRSQNDYIEGLRAGCDDFIKKPVDRIELAARIRSLARVRALTATMEENIRGLKQFASIAAHDLKAPVRAINNLSNWIEEDYGSITEEELRDLMQRMRRKAAGMMDLIEGILAYSKAGLQAAPKEAVEVRALIERVIELLAPPARMTVTIAENMPAFETQRLQLQQVFQNLIGNAVRYHGPGPGSIDITWRTDDEGVYFFSVADDGPGIDPAHHERIFDAFTTLRSRDEGGGTGIGLALVKRLVENRGGGITLQSALGQGATFTFSWPLRT